MAEGCPTLDLVDRFNSTPPAGAPAVRTPFIILFDGSAGSSWFAESLDRTIVGAGARARLRGGEGNLQRVLERISLEGQKFPGARA